MANSTPSMWKSRTCPGQQPHERPRDDSELGWIHDHSGGESACGPCSPGIGARRMDRHQHSKFHVRRDRAGVAAVGFDRNHPVADTVFNPLVRPGTTTTGTCTYRWGWRAGETPGDSQTLPQRLDTFMANFADHARHQFASERHARPERAVSHSLHWLGSESLCIRGRARGEIYAYGFRTRTGWIGYRIESVPGERHWPALLEEINIVTKAVITVIRSAKERTGLRGRFRKTGSLKNPPVAFPDRDLLHVDASMSRSFHCTRLPFTVIKRATPSQRFVYRGS